nr:immunoglobulin heavy chain junction region [Mus musculus]
CARPRTYYAMDYW